MKILKLIRVTRDEKIRYEYIKRKTESNMWQVGLNKKNVVDQVKWK